jgi:hypothetical protein
MRAVAAGLAAVLPIPAGAEVSHSFVNPNNAPSETDILIVSNVMNEGEGVEDCSAFLAPVVSRFTGLEHVVVIEPATESTARQMCGLVDRLEGFTHVGPCPSGGASCSEWTFREFRKRVYPFERCCLGRWSPAARTAKYALALISRSAAPRSLGAAAGVVIGAPARGGLVRLCNLGEKSMHRCRAAAGPWDLLDESGQLVKNWP